VKNYRYSALGPVWSETRAQSVDWYSSCNVPGCIIYGSSQVVSYTVAVEVIMGTTKIIVSMYFDRELQIEHDLRKMEEVINHAKGTGVLFAADSNARSPHGMTS